MIRKPVLLTMTALFAASLMLAGKADARRVAAEDGWDDESSQATVSADDRDDSAVDSRASRKERARELKEEKKRAQREKDKAKVFGVGVDLYGGYSYFNLGKWNDNHKEYMNYQYNQDGVAVHQGYHIGLDVNANFFRNILSVGPRIQYHGLFEHSEDITTYHYGYYGSYTTKTTNKYSGGMVPLMLGVAVANPGAVSGQLALNVGYAWGSFVYDTNGNSFTLSGSTPIVETRASVRFGRTFHGGLNLGYRWANFTNMEHDGNKANLDFDFGGFDLGGQIGYNF